MKRKRIIISTIIVAVLLVITIGISYAYFSANMEGTEEATTITVGGGSLRIIYDGGENINISNVFPQDNAVATKTFTVTGNNTTDLEMKYDLILVIESNTFSSEAIKYKLISENTDNNGEVSPSITISRKILNGSNIYDLGTGSFEGPTNNKIHTYKLELYFPNEAYDQNIEQGKSLKGHIEIQNYSESSLLSAQIDGEFTTTVPVSTTLIIESLTCYKKDGEVIEGVAASIVEANWVINTGVEERCVCKMNLTSPLYVNFPIDLPEGMIPVAYDSTGQTIKADKNNKNAGWYDYSQYKWANAVLVTSTNRETYKESPVGTIIPEADILAYYVWIPRFSYTLWNINTGGGTTATERQINVTLQKMTDPVNNGITNGAELTHPAFWWDKDDDNIREAGEELNGFWVGKFELTGDTTTPTIKPNLSSLRTQKISSLWTTIEKFKTSSIYGINESLMNSHMMKNMEWGAVAYLSNSQYGNRCNSSTETEIFINPSNRYITGRSGNSVSHGAMSDISGTASVDLYSWNGKVCSTKSGDECTGAIHATYGPSASTTGTIYGVYDMSGGAFEYVMGNMASSTANFTNRIMNPRNGGTAFGSYTDLTLPKRYFDVYNYGTTSTDAAAFARGKLGDATKEVLAVVQTYNAWNEDISRYFYSTSPWLRRGGAYGGDVGAGVFYMFPADGNAHGDYTSRAVLIVEV